MSRRPKPTALRVLEGNPGKRALGRREPQPSLGAPVQPPWISREAKTVWRELTPILQRMGVLTEADGLALAALCEEFATYKRLRRRTRYHETYETGGGMRRLTPDAAAADACLRQVRCLLAEFGLTPSARARLALRESEDDELATLLESG